MKKQTLQEKYDQLVKDNQELLFALSCFTNAIDIICSVGDDIGKERAATYTTIQKSLTYKRAKKIIERHTYFIEFNKGDKVFDKLHNCTGTVLDNYGDAKNGDGGEIRLDSDGNVPIYTLDSNYNIIGYNLIKIENE